MNHDLLSLACIGYTDLYDQTYMSHDSNTPAFLGFLCVLDILT